MMKRKVLVLWVMCFVLVGLLLTPVSNGAAREKVRITFWGWGDFATAVETYLKVNFEKKNPEIEIVPVRLGPWDLMDKYLTCLAAGSGAPEVAELVRRRFSTYALSGGLLDLTDKAMKYKKDILPAAWDDTVFNGRVYGMAPSLCPSVVYYRKDISDKYGVDGKSIVTWDDFLEAGKKLTVDTNGDGEIDQYMFQAFFPSGDWGASAWVMWAQSKKANIFTEDGKVIRNNRLAREIFEWYCDFGLKKGIAYKVAVNSPEYFAGLKEGRFVYQPFNIPTAAVIKRQAPELAGKWRVMSWPLWTKEDEPKYAGNWGGAVLTIAKQIKHKEEAWKFLEYISTSVEGQEGVWIAGYNQPTYIPVLKKSKIFEKGDPYFGGQVVYEVIKARVVPPWYYFHEAEVSNIVGNALDSVYAGERTAGEAWDWAEETIAKRLGR